MLCIQKVFNPCGPAQAPHWGRPVSCEGCGQSPTVGPGQEPQLSWGGQRSALVLIWTSDTERG